MLATETLPRTSEAPKALTPVPFTPAEIDAMHGDDRHAATAIIGIMVTIFLAAVAGYTAVAWIAGQ